MNRWIVLITAFVVAAIIAVGCSGDNGNPVVLTADPGLSEPTSHAGQTQTHLWGYYTVYMDLENGRVEAVPMRHSAGVEPSPFNVVDFVNGNPANLGFDIKETIVDPAGEYITVDIDVSIMHPFPGMPNYNGYDVKGIFIGDGHGVLAYNGLKYALEGTDQFVGHPPDPCVPPDPCYGNPDGYTRWWNPSEFGTPGVLGYTPGAFATPDYNGNATLNPFKYYADCIAPEDELEDIFPYPPDPCHRIFSSGETNTRSYFLNFPTPSPNVKFNYAILAHWESEDIHPAYGAEATGAMTVTQPDLYYVDSSNNGGSLILDIGVFSPPPDDGLEAIFIESEILSDVYQLNAAEMMPLIDGIPYTSTYHTEIPADNLTESGYTEFWIMLQYTGCDYQNDYNVPNQAGTDPLISYYRHNLYISDTSYNSAPVIDSGIDGEAAPFYMSTETYTVTAHDDDGDILSWSWDVTEVATSTELISDDPGNGDGTIDIDFNSLGASEGDEYLIECEVSDSVAAPVAADSLTVTASTTIYHYDGTIDDGGMTEMSGGSCHWTFLDSHDAWDENGNTNDYDNNCCTILATPQLDIPSGVTNLHLVLASWGNAEAAWDGGFIGYTTDSGSTITINGPPGTITIKWLTTYSGDGFIASYPNLYNYSTSGCSWITNMPFSGWWDHWFCYDWQNSTNCWGSYASPSVSDFTCNSLIGVSDVQFVFIFRSDQHVSNGSGWAIREIEVYIDP